MKKAFTFLFLILLLLHLQTDAQNMQWTKQMANTSDNGNNYANGNGVAVDANGNVYSVGTFFQDTIDFDPGAGTYFLESPFRYSAYISKLDASGNFVWARKFGGSNSTCEAKGHSIALDAAGNIYIFGAFTDTIDFDPGPAIQNLTTPPLSPNNFIVKLDNSGNLVWAKQMAGDSIGGGDEGGRIAVDAQANIYLTGEFAGTVDFDPGPGVFDMTAITIDIFISKMDSSGDLLWAKQITSDSLSWGYGNSIAVDNVGNVYTTGDFHGTFDFNPGTGTDIFVDTGTYAFNNALDIFITKHDSSGNFVWAKQLGNSSTGGCLGESFCLAVNTSGNIYLTGRFRGSIDFDPGPLTNFISSASPGHIFVCRLDTSGNFDWVEQFGSNGRCTGTYITTDNTGDIYVTGTFASTVDFDPGSGTDTLRAIGGSLDGFILKMAPAGNYVWVKQFHGITSYNQCASSCITIDAGGNIYTTGSFGSTIDFDPGPGNFNLTSVAQLDIFVNKLDQLPTNVYETTLSWDNIEVYPNPLSDQATIKFSVKKKETIFVNIFDVNGRLVSIITDKQFEAGENELTWNTAEVKAGIYFLKFQSGENMLMEKLIVTK
jgi:hypothetical protein